MTIVIMRVTAAIQTPILTSTLVCEQFPLTTEWQPAQRTTYRIDKQGVVRYGRK